MCVYGCVCECVCMGVCVSVCVCLSSNNGYGTLYILVPRLITSSFYVDCSTKIASDIKAWG